MPEGEGTSDTGLKRAGLRLHEGKPSAVSRFYQPSTTRACSAVNRGTAIEILSQVGGTQG